MQNRCKEIIFLLLYLALLSGVLKMEKDEEQEEDDEEGEEERDPRDGDTYL